MKALPSKSEKTKLSSEVIQNAIRYAVELELTSFYRLQKCATFAHNQIFHVDLLGRINTCIKNKLSSKN